MKKTLIVHIGTGKTGSTAIQSYLSKRRDELAEEGVHYWGLNLEYADTTYRYSWQKPDGISLLQRMPDEDALEELSTAIEEGLKNIDSGDTAIWSNESIYERPNLYIPLLKLIQAKENRRIAIYAYARRMREYLLSAYKQWGVKHKTYPGRILGFKEWIHSKREFLSYGVKLAQWDKAFDNAFKLINYNSLPDVVSDFLAKLPASNSRLLPKQSKSQENLTPSDIHLALYALYNNQFSGPVLPHGISTLLGRYNLERGNYRITPLSSIYPSSEDLIEAESMFSDEVAMVNRILHKCSQPPLDSPDRSQPLDQLSEQEITQSVLSLLVTILVEQDNRITKLEKLLANGTSNDASPGHLLP